jgi:protein tyrosine/serine phosphatase
MRIRLLFVFVLACAGFAAEAPVPVAHVRNFGVVNPHLLRGGEPTAVGLAELGAAGVKVDIDLREAGPATEFEQQQAKKLGMNYTNVPLPPLSAPSAAEIHNILNLIAHNQSQIVFLHCRRGKDRTGTVIACYRIQHDGWDHDRALDEAKHYGMSFAERGMRTFILHFSPLPEPNEPLLLAH